ncbi:hypothetical protein GCM10023353_37140 [Tomitella cavernea]|uniref:Uncharacterized protein n=1 Tax=Tomitella cavernea TaxID=1387982 RepID=A0ABP9D7T3_9ACTN
MVAAAPAGPLGRFGSRLRPRRRPRLSAGVVTRRGSGDHLTEYLGGHGGEFALVRIGEPPGEFSERHPLHFADLVVLIGELAALVAEQEVMDGLVDAAAVGNEPVVDASE